MVPLFSSKNGRDEKTCSNILGANSNTFAANDLKLVKDVQLNVEYVTCFFSVIGSIAVISRARLFESWLMLTQD